MTQSRTIEQMIPRINDDVLLPGIQREFVWEPDQMVQLFDSVMRGYPIGSFLFWEISGAEAENRMKYKFIKNFITEGTFPNEFDGKNFRNPKINEITAELSNRLTLVLDGQQRLTTFYIGLKGSLTERGYRLRREKPESWTEKKLYIDLLSDPSKTTDDKKKMKYRLEFKQPVPEQSDSEYWYEVGNILSINNRDELFDFQKRVVEDVGEAYSNNIRRNSEELWRAVYEKEIINYFELGSNHSDDILDIFIRANEGGTQLGKEEILLSMATAKWSQGRQSIDARNRITAMVDRLNEYNVEAGFDFDTGFILRNLLVVSNLPIKYDIENFTDENLKIMKEVFQEDKFEQAIKDTIDLISSFGLDGRSVSSSVAIMPIISFLYENPDVQIGSGSKQGRKTRQRLFYWLCTTLLKGTYQAGPYTLVTAIRKDIQSARDGEFPIEQLQDTLLRNGNRTITFIEEEAREILNDIEKNNRHDKVILSLIYYPDPANEHNAFHVDHIFPKSSLSSENLVENHNMGIERARRYENLRDSVLNLQYLTPEENEEKSNKQFSEWINTRTEDERQRHNIPNNEELYKIENFEEFLNTREDLITNRLLKMSESLEKEIGVQPEAIQNS